MDILDIIEGLGVLIIEYPAFKYMIMFAGAALGGELVLFTFGFLSAQGAMPLMAVVVFGFTGAFAPNLVWYLLGRTNMVNKVVSNPYANNTVTTVTQAVDKISKGNPWLAFVIIKFLIGTPVALTMYISKNPISFKKFMYYQSSAIAVSFALLVSIGYASGLGYSYLAQIFKDVYVGIGFVLLVVVGIVVAQLWFEKKFTGSPTEKKTENNVI